jgi:hypothetical protein
MSQDATIDNVLRVMRKHQGIAPKQAITAGTVLEDDLGRRRMLSIGGEETEWQQEGINNVGGSEEDGPSWVWA